MTSLITLLLACMPAEPETATFKGPGVSLKQTVSNDSISLELVGADGKTRWRLAQAPGWFRPTFSKTGKYVAEASGLQDAPVEYVGPDGALHRVRPLELVSEDETSAMGQTSCGLDWFQGLRFEGDATLVVQVRQAPRGRPTDAPDPTPPIEVFVDLASGKLSRKTAPLRLKAEDLMAVYRTSPAKRVEVAAQLVRKVSQPGGATPELVSFARAELPAAKDPEVQAALLTLVDAAGAAADREWVAARAQEAGWPPGNVMVVLLRLKPERPEALVRYARWVLEKKLGTNNDRVAALGAVTSEPDALKFIQAGLEDPDSYVRDAAERAARELPASDENFAWLGARAERPLARIALTGRYVSPDERTQAPNPWLPKFEAACERTLKAKWPGCEAWTGAMADARGERGLAEVRYGRALAGVTRELAASTVWSPEVETFFRLHVRLAQLARAEKKSATVEQHLAAMRQSRWWDQFRVECSSGLPRAFDPKCDGGAHRERMVQILEGKTKP